jgi:hypothetical protein
LRSLLPTQLSCEGEEKLGSDSEELGDEPCFRNNIPLCYPSDSALADHAHRFDAFESSPSTSKGAVAFCHRRWTEPEIEFVREELVKDSVERVARKLKRSPKAIRSMLKRHRLSSRDIRCDRFSLESLAIALHVNKAEIHFWIRQGWLQAVVETSGKKQSYTITPEALTLFYKRHLPDVLKRGIPNQSLFQAYLEYCYSSKHTVGEQLLDVRRDKKERAAYAELQGQGESEEEEDMDDDDGYPLTRNSCNTTTRKSTRKR